MKNLENQPLVISHIIKDIASGGNQAKGAKFVLKYTKSLTDEVLEKISAFERYSDDIVGGVRWCDIVEIGL